MHKFARTLLLLCLPVLLASCSMDDADSISEQDAEKVKVFCVNNSNFSEFQWPTVLDFETDYLSNVAILLEKYPEDLELKQLNLSVQTAIGYVSWLREGEILMLDGQLSFIEDFEKEFGSSTPPVSVSAVTSSLKQSCEPFSN
jgi:hypothetical protein